MDWIWSLPACTKGWSCRGRAWIAYGWSLYLLHSTYYIRFKYILYNPSPLAGTIRTEYLSRVLRLLPLSFCNYCLNTCTSVDPLPHALLLATSRWTPESDSYLGSGLCLQVEVWPSCERWLHWHSRPDEDISAQGIALALVKHQSPL